MSVHFRRADFKISDCGYRMFSRMSQIFKEMHDNPKMQSREEFSVKIKERVNFSNSLSHSNFYKILIE